MHGTRTIPATSIWTRLPARHLQFTLDVVVLVAAFALAYFLRFDFAIPHEIAAHGLVQLPVVVMVQLATLSLTGVYAFIWRYIGMAEVRTFVKAALLAAIPLVVLRLGLPDSHEIWRVPLSIIVVDTVLAFGGVLGLRVARRALYERDEK